MKAKCVKCGMMFVMGRNGVVDFDTQEDMCDGCAGVTRDVDGYAISQDDRMQGFSVYEDVDTGQISYRLHRTQK